MVKLTQLQTRVIKLKKLAAIKGKTDNEVASMIKKSGDGFLYTSEWKRLKEKAHEVYGYTCMRCKKTPKNKKDSNVDHIKPRKHFPELSLDFDNLQVLCGDCNKKKGNKHYTDYRNQGYQPWESYVK